MTTCQIDYIEDLQLTGRDEKDRLTDLHLSVARQLFSHRIHNNGYSNQIFTYANNRLYVPGNSVYFKQARDLIKIINNNLGFDAVTLIDDPNQPLRHYVSIDVRDDRNEPVDPIQLQTFYRKYFGDTDIVQLNAEFEDEVTNHEDVFNEIADDIKNKIGVYLKSLPESGDQLSVERTRQDLVVLLGVLKDRSTSGLVQGLSKYVVTSTKNLNNIKRRLNIINDLIRNLDPDPTKRKEQISQVSDFVRQSSYFYHLFDILEDIQNELKKLGANPSAVHNYERDLLEKDFRDFLQREGISEDDAQDFLNKVPALLQDSGDLMNNFKAVYKSSLPDPSLLTVSKLDQLEDEIRDILNKNMKKGQGVHQQLVNTLNELRPFKLRLQDLHYETLTEVYYPVFEKTFDGVNNKKTIDGQQTLEQKYKISRTEFKNLLKIGENDISFHSRWGAAMINVNEVVMNTIANYFKDLMIDIDLNNKEDISTLQKFLASHNKTEKDLTEHNTNFVHENLTIDAIQEVDDTFVPEGDKQVISITMFGETRKYRARKTKNLLNEYNNIAYNNNKKVFQYLVDGKAEEFAALLMSDSYALVNLETNPDPVLKTLYDTMYTTFNGTVVLRNHIGKFFNSNPVQDEVKGKIKSLLYQSFYSNHLKLKDESLINQQLIDNGVYDINGDAVDLNDDGNIRARKHVLNNSSWNNYKEYNRGNYSGSTLKDRFFFNSRSLFGKNNGNMKEVLVKFEDYTLGYIEVFNTANGIVVSNTSGKEILQFATFSKEYTSLKDSYHILNGGFGQEGIRKWNWIHDGGFNEEYFDRIIDLYKASNANFGPIGLRNREIPQVKKTFNKLQAGQNFFAKMKGGEAGKMFDDYLSSYWVEENKIPLMRNGQYIDEDGNPVNDPVYVSTERQYINNQKVREVPAKFIAPIDTSMLEDDLYKSILMYKTSSNTFRGLKDNESQALMLQTILEGDKTLGIEPRKVKVKKNGTDVRVPGAGLKYKESDLNSSKLILSFINDYVFHQETDDYGILGSRLSAKKVASIIGGYTAFTALAWNITTMPSNALISLVNTRTVAQDNQFFNETDWNESVKIYAQNYGQFMNDFKNKGFTIQKSLITQLGIRFNAMQGDFLSPQGVIESKNVYEKMSDSALFWTQEIVEHANQTQSMIMLMKGYTLPSGRNLWQAIQEENQNRLDGQEVKMPQEFTRDLEIEFQKRMQGVNRQIHGNYNKLDKNDLQRGIWTKMFMLFRKYIYDGFRSRFQEERWDQELKDEQEGYFRTYLKYLNREFAETAKTQGLLAAVKSSGPKTIGTSLLKATLGGWDAATFRFASKNKTISEFLYGKREQDGGDITDRQYYAAMKATYDIGNVVRAMLVVALSEALLSGLDDDDEEMKALLTYIDIYARKMENDVGFFTSFTNVANGGYAGPTFDQVYKLIRDPFTASRTIDNTTGVFRQLTDFDTINEEGDLEFSWGALDKYEKSGPGYEKGDYKITRKLQKSIVAPWWQMVKLMDPDQQLKYLNMVYKSSN